MLPHKSSFDLKVDFNQMAKKKVMKSAIEQKLKQDIAKAVRSVPKINITTKTATSLSPSKTAKKVVFKSPQK